MGVESNDQVGTTAAHAEGAVQPNRQVLIVEPEELVRWSLVTYLGKWFAAFSADTQVAADRILDDQQIDALVVSTDLLDQGAEEIQARARSRNPSVTVVCTSTKPPAEKVCSRTTPLLEKPFELSELAQLLGIDNGLPEQSEQEEEGPAPTTA